MPNKLIGYLISLLLLCGVPLSAAASNNNYVFAIYDAPPWYFKGKDQQHAGMLSFLFKLIDQQMSEKIDTMPVPYQRALAWLSGNLETMPALDFIVSMTSPTISDNFVKCANLGSFTVIAYTLQPLANIGEQAKQQLTVGVLRGTASLLREILPKEVYANWHIVEFNSEHQLYNLVSKARIDAALMTLNVYQYLLDNLDNAAVGNILPLGFLEVYAWMPRQYQHSNGHHQLCAKLNAYTDNGSISLDTDEIIDTIIVQQQPDLSAVPRISQRAKDKMVDHAFKTLYPQLYQRKHSKNSGAKP